MAKESRPRSALPSLKAKQDLPAMIAANKAAAVGWRTKAGRLPPLTALFIATSDDGRPIYHTNMEILVLILVLVMLGVLRAIARSGVEW